MADIVALTDERLAVRAAVEDRYAILRRRLHDHPIWTRADMRAALANRDVAGVYRLLQRYGMSQRVIAALAGQAQSEISEIMAGRRVVSYDVLVRIADGFGIPRGRMGLAFDKETASTYFGVEEAAPENLRPLWEIFGGG
jgi:predicted XRE-type DNA-binding protein